MYKVLRFFIPTLVFVFLFSCVAQNVFAQETEVPSEVDELIAKISEGKDLPAPVVTILAEVNISDAMVWEQNGRELKIGFSIGNDGKYEPEILYAVQLYKKVVRDDTVVGDILAYEEVYPEVVSLGTGKVIEKNITFTIPATMTGEYIVRVFLANKSGLIYGGTTLGVYTFGGEGFESGVEIDPSTCHLTVKSEETEYTLLQGVDVNAQSETLSISCDNGTLYDVADIFPRLTFRERSAFGDIAKQEVLPEKVTYNGNDFFTYTIPLPTKPQSYLTKLDFVTKDGTVVSNQITFRFVVQGESATVKNVSFDKESYQAGDTAKVMVVVSGSADIFINARRNNGEIYDLNSDTVKDLTVDIQVTSDSVSCSEKITKTIREFDSTPFDLSIPIVTACEHPQINVVVASEEGNVLSALPKSEDANTLLSSRNKGQDFPVSTTMIILGVVSILFIAGVLVFVMKKQKNTDTNQNGTDVTTNIVSILVALLVSGALYVSSPPEVEAATIDINYGTLGALLTLEGWYTVTPINTPCNGYVTGEAQITLAGCGNTAVTAEIWIDGERKYSHYHDEYAYTTAFSGLTSGIVSKTIGPITSSGAKNMRFDFVVDSLDPYVASGTFNSVATRTLPYTVGVCTDFTQAVVSNTGCANNATSTGTMSVSITGTTTPVISYSFKCGAEAWFNNGLDNTYECVFNSPGIKHIGFRVLDASGPKEKWLWNQLVQSCDPDFTPTALLTACVGSPGSVLARIINPNVTVSQYGFKCDGLSGWTYGGSASQTCSYTTAGPRMINYYIKDINGREKFRDFTIDVPQCAADFTVGLLTAVGCATAGDGGAKDGRVDINVTGETIPVVKYGYKCDDQVWATTTSNTHSCTFDGPGVKTIRIAVLDTNGSYRVQSHSVTVYPCLATFTTSVIADTSYCAVNDDGGVKDGRVTATITNPNVPVVSYIFKCAGDPTSHETTSNSYTCIFDNYGDKNVEMSILDSNNNISSVITGSATVHSCDCVPTTGSITIDGTADNKDVALGIPFNLAWNLTSNSPTYTCRIDTPSRSTKPDVSNASLIDSFQDTIFDPGATNAEATFNPYTLYCESAVCPDISRSVNASIVPPPVDATVSSDKDVLLVTETVRFQVTAKDGVKYEVGDYDVEWTGDSLFKFGKYTKNDGTPNDDIRFVDVNFSTLGTKCVKVVVTDKWGWQDDDTKCVDVSDNRKPQ